MELFFEMPVYFFLTPCMYGRTIGHAALYSCKSFASNNPITLQGDIISANVGYCQDQPKLQVKLSLISINPATHPPWKVYVEACMHYVVAKH